MLLQNKTYNHLRRKGTQTQDPTSDLKPDTQNTQTGTTKPLAHEYSEKQTKKTKSKLMETPTYISSKIQPLRNLRLWPNARR